MKAMRDAADARIAAVHPRMRRPGTVARARPFSLGVKVVVSGGAACIALMTLFIAAEYMLRYRERHRSTVPGTMPLLFYRHERLGHALVRDMDYFGWVRTDANGFRVTPKGGVATPAAVRIIADGGSTTFDGNTGADGRAWPARLQHWLSALAPDARVDIANAGVPGYRVIDNLIRMQTELYGHRPDMVILLQGHNDLFRALRDSPRASERDPSRPGEIQSHSFLRSWLSKHSLFYAKVQERVNLLAFRRRGRRSLAQTAQSGTAFARRLAEGTEQFERDLRGYVAIAGALGVRVALVSAVHRTAPSTTTVAADEATIWRNAIPFAPPEVVLEGYRRYNDILRRVAEDTGSLYIDARTFDLHGAEFYDAGDPVHFSPRGADAMGRNVARALIEAGALRRAQVWARRADGLTAGAGGESGAAAGTRIAP